MIELARSTWTEVAAHMKSGQKESGRTTAFLPFGALEQHGPHLPLSTDTWIDPRQFEQWWIPAPMACRVDLWEPSMGGAFVTSVSEDGENFVPHMDACFLLVEHLERIVFTNALDSHWRPADPTPVRITAEITLVDHPEGTLYRAVVRHADPAARTHHGELGFFEGWGAATAQLAGKAEEAGAAHGAE